MANLPKDFFTFFIFDSESKSRDFRISKKFDFDTRNGSSTDRYEPVCSIYDQVNYEAWHNLFTNGLEIQQLEKLTRCIWNDYFYTYGCLVPLI